MCGVASVDLGFALSLYLLKLDHLNLLTNLAFNLCNMSRRSELEQLQEPLRALEAQSQIKNAR
jgi:hypothetical protein